LAAAAPLRADLKGEADVIFLTGGINQQFIMGRPGLSVRQQLAGRKIGFVGDGGLNDSLVKFAIHRLAKAGVNGLRAQAIPAGGRRQLEALLRGECDALVITPPESIEAHRLGCEYLIDFKEYGLNYALGGIAVRRDTINSRPDVVRRFIKAYVEGMHRYRTDREFTIAVQAEYSAIKDPTVAAETYDLTQPGMPRIPYPVLPALQTLLDFMSEELPEAKNADARQFVDESFIRELEASGFIDSLSVAMR
jgi:ABC-type nitrate/sulfonate/bicarbonate transport system substrate-binding protein